MKKRGRKTKEEYYMKKEVDKVEIEQVYIICLPIILEDLNQVENIKREEEIMFSTPFTPVPYQESSNFYSEVSNLSNDVEFVIKPGDKILKKEVKQITSKFIVEEQVYENKLVPDSILAKGDTNLKIKSEVVCFWCCHNFEGNPVFMPVDLIKDVYKVKGCFCSFECCNAYMQDSYKYKSKKHLLNYMFRDLVKDRKDKKIGKAPPREMLRMFGGFLSIEEFRDNNSKYEIAQYPMIYLSNQVTKNVKTKNIEKEVKTLLPVSKNKTKTKVSENSLSKLIGLNV